MSGIPPEIVEAGERLIAYCEGTHPLTSLRKKWRNGPYPHKAEAVRRLLDSNNPELRGAWKALVKNGKADWGELIDLLSGLPNLLDARKQEAKQELRRLQSQVEKQARVLAALLRQIGPAADACAMHTLDWCTDPLRLMHATGIHRLPEAELTGDPIIPTRRRLPNTAYPRVDEMLETLADRIATDGLAVHVTEAAQMTAGRERPGKSAVVMFFDLLVQQNYSLSLHQRQRRIQAVAPAWLGAIVTSALLAAAVDNRTFKPDDVRKARRKTQQKN